MSYFYINIKGLNYNHLAKENIVKEGNWISHPRNLETNDSREINISHNGFIMIKENDLYEGKWRINWSFKVRMINYSSIMISGKN